MIYPKRKATMAQLVGSGKIQALMEGSERIYSRKDTLKILQLARRATTNEDLYRLGKFVYDATKRQDSKPPEYTEK